MSSPALIRFVLLLGAGLLCAYWVASPGPVPRIERTASGVEGFDLVFDDSAAPAAFGLFETGYAIKANYGYFTYRGKLYRPVGGGSVVMRPVADSPAKFIVRETAQSSDGRGYVGTSLLQVLDKSNGEELAHRRLVAHAVEDGTGWTGDHAVKFVRKVLHSQQAPGRPWGVVDYKPAVAKVDVIRSLETSPYPAQTLPRNCPDTLRIERRPSGSTVQGNGFEFLPSNPLQLVACNSGRILVASGVYASDLSLDLLTLDGEHIAQGYIRLPLPLEARWSDMTDVDRATEIIKTTLLVNSHLDWKSPATTYAHVQISTTLTCRKTGCVSESPQ